MGQRKLIDKDFAPSREISTKALFLIAKIAAKESCNVATFDVPGAYIQTELKDEKVDVKSEGKVAELIDPEKRYWKHMAVEHGKKVLYAELAKVRTLLLWGKVSAQFVDWGFVFNIYDWCVASKEVEYEVPDLDSQVAPGHDAE